MRLQSLESRVVILFISLLLVLQLAGYFFIDNAIDKNARASIESSLSINEKIMGHLLDQNAERLVVGATLLSKDYAFRQAIASNDTQTIVSALLNHGDRIKSDLTMLVGLDGKIIDASSDTLARGFQETVSNLVNDATLNGNASSTNIVNGKPYQMVMVPVKAPVFISWVAMAIPIDQGLVNDMRALSLLQVSLFTSENNGPWISDVSTLDATQEAALAKLIPTGINVSTYIRDLTIGENRYSARVLPLAKNKKSTTIAVLQLSVSDVIAPYKKLQRNLLLLTVMGGIAACILSILTARRIAGPVRQLADTARRLGAGDYKVNIDIERKDEIGDLAASFSHMRDAIAQREKEISHLAYWDTLTTLPNRALFTEMLDEAIVQAKSLGNSCFVLMMDLDRFKHVNDVMGHRFGDLLLIEVAFRLRAGLGIGNIKPARLGGDEFAILLPSSNAVDALRVANKILESLEKPISIEDQAVDISAGIGIAGFPEHAIDTETLLGHTEVAMYVAKQAKNGPVIYTQGIDKSSQQSLSLLTDMRIALEQNHFQLYAQPKLSLSTNEVIAVETLVRWVHPEKGMVFPDQFIPFAEQTGFIRQLTRWVMNAAAECCHAWSMAGIDLKMSVNISTRDLMDQDLPQKFAEILQLHGVQPQSFCLEITESAIMDDPQRAHQTLDKLHAMGMELSIDDFGTGYSSLAYLKRLPVDELKIDKSFVLKMEQDIDDTKIVKSTIDLGHNMGLRVVAEGIENAEVMALLKELGCDQAQGYFISRPMPVTNMPAWLKQWRTSQPA
ncbi:EAL domain-containing protein [Undibacterium sp. RuRC25W]|uniref:bifunctional diguanylate cyclase/phosphodiesterase n=1 Tax=Undibacterium sp. RuRC25W TaxID=3413047 RepID=UPI003BF1056A